MRNLSEEERARREFEAEDARHRARESQWDLSKILSEELLFKGYGVKRNSRTEEEAE